MMSGDQRLCHNGLFDYAEGSEKREVYAPLAEQLRNQHDQLDLLQHAPAASPKVLDEHMVGEHYDRPRISP